MGTDKRHVHLGGISLLERALRTLEPVADDLLVVTRDEEGTFGRARVICDVVKDRGPMAGILTGLRAIRHLRALVIPVDMPLLRTDLLARLIVLSEGWDITVPCRGSRIEPLVGVYTTACIRELEEPVARWQTSVSDFIRSTGLAARYVTHAELHRFGDPDLLFLNVNTVEDVRKAEAHLRSPSAGASRECQS
jgi:molybdopterin-guanine dinucleotide biosynthesis protein A